MTDESNTLEIVPQPDEQQSQRLGREDWINAAMEVFMDKGIDAVRVERLAQGLNVTKGSFYWHFKNRKELHEAIIEHWGQRCTLALTLAIQPDGKAQDIIDVVLSLFEIWLREEPFSPRLDAAMRDWARRSENVQRAVVRADTVRTEAIAQAFVRAGYPEREALIRARIVYFMQIGYYEADLHESMETRIDYTTEYIKGFTGLELDDGRKAAYRARFLPDRS